MIGGDLLVNLSCLLKGSRVRVRTEERTGSERLIEVVPTAPMALCERLRPLVASKSAANASNVTALTDELDLFSLCAMRTGVCKGSVSAKCNSRNDKLKPSDLEAYIQYVPKLIMSRVHNDIIGPGAMRYY